MKFYTKWPPLLRNFLFVMLSILTLLLYVSFTFGFGGSGATLRFLNNNRLLVGVGLILLLSGSYLFIKGKGALLSKVWGYTVRHWKILFTLLLIAYFLLFTALGYWKHLNMQTSLYDFGLEHQVVWNTSEGRLFEASVEVQNYMGDHVSPIIVLPAAVYRIFPEPLTVFALQSLAVTIGIAGVGLTTRKILHKKRLLVILLTAAYALHWGTLGHLHFDYHPVVFAIPFAVWGIYFDLFSKKKLLAAGLFLLSMLAKEDVGVFIAGYGLTRALAAKDKWGWVWAIGGTVISLVGLFVIIPIVRQAPSDTLARYGELGSSMGEITKTLLLNPGFMLDYIFSSYGRVSYIVKLFLPFLFIPLLRPQLWLLFLPNIAINILSAVYAQHGGFLHYDGLIVIGIWLATTLTLQELFQKSSKTKLPLKAMMVWALIIVSYFVVHPSMKDLFETPYRLPQQQALMQFVETLPKDAQILADNSTGGQLGEFRNLKLYYPNWTLDWPKAAEGADYIFVDQYRYFDAGIEEQLASDKARGFKVEREFGDIIVLSRE